jgi:hypothetical protein
MYENWFIQDRSTASSIAAAGMVPYHTVWYLVPPPYCTIPAGTVINIQVWYHTTCWHHTYQLQQYLVPVLVALDGTTNNNNWWYYHNIYYYCNYY